MMKKLLLIALACAVSITTFAQSRSQTNISDSTCFCCSGFYNLPTPVITGPLSVACGSQPQYSITTCPGATINWAVSPSVSFTGNGTNRITLTSPLPPSGYSISVTISCGRGQVTNNVRVNVNALQNCTADFTITVRQLPAGNINIDAIPVTTAGAEHWWGIVYNGAYPNCTVPCVAIPFATIQSSAVFGGVHETAAIPTVFSQNGGGSGVTAGSSGYGINYSGFPNNCCFKVTHYINCCGVWYKQTQCVSIGTSNLKTANATEMLTPSISKTEVEKVDESELQQNINPKAASLKRKATQLQ